MRKWFTKYKYDLQILAVLMLAGLLITAGLALGSANTSNIEPDCKTFTPQRYEQKDVPVVCYQKYEKGGLNAL